VVSSLFSGVIASEAVGRAWQSRNFTGCRRFSQASLRSEAKSHKQSVAGNNSVTQKNNGMVVPCFFDVIASEAKQSQKFRVNPRCYPR
jgi:hypothetical protein